MNAKPNYTVYSAIALRDVKLELRKHFDGTYSVANIDKHGNETIHIRDKFGKANAKYLLEKSKL